MFLHSFKYSFKSLIRNKTLLFWSLLFTAILGTCFKIAFSGITESTESLTIIKVAVFYEAENQPFGELMAKLSSGEDNLLEIKEATEEEALKMLNDGDLAAIIDVGSEGKISLRASSSSPMSNSSNIQISIVQNIIEQYNAKAAILEQIGKENPTALPAAVQAVAEDVSGICAEEKLSEGNMDVYNQYFFNLIAMGVIMSISFGTTVALGIQGNLSPLAARRCVSPTRKSVSALGGLCAAIAAAFMISCVTILFVRFVLDVDLGKRLPMYFVTAFAGTVMAVCIGYAIGSAGNLSENSKGAIATMFSTFGGFLSGLMILDMRMIIAEKAPIIHKINPSSILFDSFYSLSMFDDWSRYIRSIISMLIISALCFAAGSIMTRRQKYASL